MSPFETLWRRYVDTLQRNTLTGQHGDIPDAKKTATQGSATQRTAPKISRERLLVSSESLSPIPLCENAMHPSLSHTETAARPYAPRGSPQIRRSEKPRPFVLPTADKDGQRWLTNLCHVPDVRA